MEIALSKGQYQSANQIMADFLLVFDNARKFNQSGSSIYTNATTLRALVCRNS
jgi:hypothetical protein